MKGLLFRLQFPTLVIWQVFWAQDLWAAGNRQDFPGEVFWQIFSFVLLVILLSYVSKKPIHTFLTKRQKDIKDFLENAFQKESESLGLFEEWDKKLNLLNQEIAGLHQRIKQEGDGELQRIIERAMQEGERIKKQAQLIAEQEVKKARVALKKEMADLALELAEKLLIKAIHPEDQERLVNEFIANIKEVR